MLQDEAAWWIGRGRSKIGQIDVTRKQKPQEANLPDDPASAEPMPQDAKDGRAKDGWAEDAPAWAAPLRDMYQQVVEEPLPDFLADLLFRLDRDSQ